jgi:hypothetical protein
MAIKAMITPAKLIFENFSLNNVHPIRIENNTMHMLFSPKTIELSSLLLFRVRIKK